mgnify:CR=1 FL=1
MTTPERQRRAERAECEALLRAALPHMSKRAVREAATAIVDDPSKAPGTIVRQNPEAGAGNKIRVGDVVDLWVVGQPDTQPQQENE